MNILKQLSIKSLKLNRKRTISTMIGIILSCSLICAVATMVTSFQATLVENAVNETGYYHLKISDLTDGDIEELKKNSEIKEIQAGYELGYGKLEKGQNESKPYLKLYSMDKKLFEYLKFHLVEGRFASHENEVVISKHILKNGKVDYKIGDTIKIDVGERKTNAGEALDFSNPYHAEEEQLVDTKNYEFTVVGIMERPEYSFEAYSDPGYTVITTNQNGGKKQAYLSLKNPRSYKETIPEILGVSDYSQLQMGDLKYENYELNTELLRWEAFAFADSTVSMLYSVAGVVIFIIIFTSVFCIRNSFAIATTEKMKMYGMLASVGATKKQIRKSVIFESLLLGMAGIPVGILSGILAVIVLIKIVNNILGEFLLAHVDGIVVNISLLPIGLTVLLGMITIYLSAISSARKASKVSPIDLVRNANEVKIKGKKLRTPKVIQKVFKIGGELAYKNLKRSKKKYRTTVISLAVSIFIFITMNSLLTNMFDLTGNYYEDYEYNISIYCNGTSQEDVEKITKLGYIEESFVLYQSEEYMKIKDLSKICEIPELELQEDGYYDEESGEFIESGEGKVANLKVVALDNETFQKYCKKAGLKPEKVKKTGILCDTYLYYDDAGRQVEMRRYNYSAGETIIGKMAEEETKLTIGAVTDVRPYGLEKSYYSDGCLVVNLEEFEEMKFAPVEVSIQSNSTDDLIEELENLKLEDIGYSNLEESARAEKAMALVIKIFLYGFITVITLIGVTNIFNTITSNMELRQKEFAMLKSIGMTKKEFNRMIHLETIFYSSKALVYGIVMGILGTFGLYKAFSVKIQTGMYLPLKPIGISIVAVFVLVFVIMKYSMAKINRQNTIETIRNENI